MQDFAHHELTTTRTFRPARTTRRTPTFLGHVMTAPLRWAQRALAQQRDEKLLQAMSDVQLRDIGISRSQIHRTVREGFDR